MTDAGRFGQQPGDYLAEELGAEASLSPREAGNLLDVAVKLAERLPATLDALEAGTVDLARVRALLAVTTPMTPEQAGEVERRVLARGGRSSRSGFRRAARRAADRVDPDAAAERARLRLENRHMWKGRCADGASDVGGTLPTEVADAIWRRVTSLALHARLPEDLRTLEQVRADVYAALLLGANTGDLARNEGRTVPVEVLVTVAATTLAGLDDEPGHVAGHGSIPADVARRLAEHAHWRRVLYDPVDGTLLDVGRRRHPTDALRRFVKTRDQLCRFPGCPLPAEACDVDHTDRHGDGGATRDGNLGAACRRHHRMKDEDSGWELLQTSPGHFTWTSPVGRTYDVHPDAPWADDLPADRTSQNTHNRHSATGSTRGTTAAPPAQAERTDWDAIPDQPPF
jgi:hypothetical protein